VYGTVIDYMKLIIAAPPFDHIRQNINHSYASTVRYRNEVRQMAHVDGNDNSDLSGHNGSTNRRTIAFQFDTRSHDAVPKMPRWPRSASKREGDFPSRDIIYNRNDIRALLRRTTAAIGPFFRFLLGRIL